MGYDQAPPVSPAGPESTIDADFHAPALAPASACDALATPSSLHDGPQTPTYLKRVDDTTVLPSEPAVSRHMATCPPSTPLLDDHFHHQTMNLIVGGALATMPTSPPRQHHTRPDPMLRLPSFDALGIAAPHPDRFGSLAFNRATMNGAAGGRAHAIESELLSAFNTTQISPSLNRHPLDPKLALGSSRTIATPIRHDVATLTPPAETGEIQHNPIASVSTAPMNSSAIDPGSLGPQAPHDTERSSVNSSASSRDSAEQTGARSWIAGALNIVLTNLRTAASPANPLRVLSHALPSPSTKGYVYPVIVDAIDASTPAQPPVWIHITHAIQGRFNLPDLPSSPPSTPRPRQPTGEEDYFTQKVFGSAVSISDYSEDSTSLPRSPRPVVPPSTVNVSIVERYIPPTSSHEFLDVLNSKGPSLLMDRLVELSPDNGSLIFIYPTRKGADTFMQEYLGPILEPLLRTLLVVNNLSSDMGTRLGTMAAAQHLPDYEHLHKSISALCDRLTRRTSPFERLRDHRTSFEVVHASKEEVHIDRETWLKEWWVKQEKPRIRETMTKYAQEAQKKSSNNAERHVTPTELIQQLLDGVTKRPYPATQEALHGIEVGVFVIKRSR